MNFSRRAGAAARRAVIFVGPLRARIVFLPGLRDAASIGRMVKDLDFPLNILAGPGSPSIPELQQLGVARVSLGSSPMRATLGLLGQIAEELKTSGTYRSLENAPSHDDVNRTMQGRRP